MEFDHADIYQDLDHVVAAFHTFLAGLPAASEVLAWGDAPLVRQVSEKSACPVSFYGFDAESAWRAADMAPAEGGGMSFTVYREGREWGRFRTPLLGAHNVLNTLAALAAMSGFGATPGELAPALESFQGVKRRLETVGDYRGITVLDDFAHHPTAVAATLAAVRQGYPKRRLVAVFEPRTNTSRRSIFQEATPRPLDDADLIIVREPPDLWKAPEDDRFSSARLAADLAARGKRAFVFPTPTSSWRGSFPSLSPGTWPSS